MSTVYLSIKVAFSVKDSAGKVIHTGKFELGSPAQRANFQERMFDALNAGQSIEIQTSYDKDEAKSKLEGRFSVR